MTKFNFDPFMNQALHEERDDLPDDVRPAVELPLASDDQDDTPDE